MQAGPPPEDLHVILSRFHTWAGKNAASGNGQSKANGAPLEEIREIPYEEAIRKHRERQAARNQRRVTTQKTKAAPPSDPSPSASASSAELTEDLPPWVADLPVVSDAEPIVELKASPVEAFAGEELADPASPAVADSHGPRRRSGGRSGVKKPLAAQPSRPDSLDQVFLAAFPEPATAAFVDLPSARLTRRSKTQPKAAAPSAPPKLPAEMARIAPAPPASVRAVAAPSAKPSATKAANPPPLPASGAMASTPPANRKLAAPGIRSQRAIRTKPKPRPIAPSPLIGSPMRIATVSPAPRATVKKAASAAAVRPKRKLKRAVFRQVLANTVQQPKAALAPKNKREPDRTRRITTRFSPAEERRIEKCAAELGITVSAYLRRCALLAVTEKSSREEPDPPPTTARRPPARSARPAIQYSDPGQTLFGGWLSLLRNRFLGPPVRLSEDA